MTSVTAVICCHNAKDTIGAACASVRWADELIVVDSGSTDATAQIAGRYADRVVQEPWRGYSGQKAYATSLATHEWVFVLDSDETCSPELAAEVRAQTQATFDSVDVLSMRRRNYVYGRHVRAWDPDWQSRLIHRDRAVWSDDVLHEDRLPGAPGRAGRLRGVIEHKRYSRAGFEDYFSGRRLDERLLMVARDMAERGRRCTSVDLLVRPWLAMMKQLWLKGGILDGGYGIMLAQKTALSTQLKYAALWAVQHNLDDGSARLDDDPGSPELPAPDRSADA